MNIAIILAAGSSTRFQSKIPKILVHLKGKPVLQWSVEVLCNHPQIEAVIIVAARDYIEEIKIALKPNLKVRAVVEGGRERHQSVARGLEFCYKNFSSVNNVLIHDGARPLINATMVDGLLDTLNNCSAVTLAVPAWELIAKTITGDAKQVAEFPDRRYMYVVQTPQGFHFEKLYTAHKNYGALKPSVNVYDDCGLFQWAFHHETIRIVEGSRQNIKITHPYDIGVAEALMENSTKSFL